MRFMRRRREDREKLPAGSKKLGLSGRFVLKMFWFADIALIVALLLELFVFNYASFLLVGGKYTAKSLSLASASITGFTQNPVSPGEYVATSERPTVEFKDIDQRVRTLYVDASTNKEKRFELQIELDYTDSARSTYNHSPKLMRLVPDLERTKYTACAFSGDMGNLKLTFQVDKGETIHINDVWVNTPIPYNISYLRILLIVLASTAIYALLRAPSFRLPYDEGSRVQNGVVLAVIIAFLMLIVSVFWLYCSPISKPFQQTSGDQVSQELVDAFSKGQVSLLKQPPQNLLDLSNPYDAGTRTNAGIVYSWDHVLYNGKYYSYYGIAPVLLLFFPYHALTGYYFPSYLACALFGLIGAVFLAFAYLAMMRRWFRGTPFHLMVCGLVILLMSCGVLLCVERPMFYEMEEAAGFMFFTAGIFSLFVSGILTEGEIKLRSLVISAVCISLAVMSRPTIALYAVVLIVWLLYGFASYHKTHPRKRQTAGYFVAAFLPYVLLGGLQMVYNYLRFGSVLEFGIRYSLTINDFTHTEFYPEIAFVSFWNFLFSIPVMKSVFPFFTGNLDKWGMNGYYFAETGNTFGIFWRALPLFSYAAAPCVLHRIDRRQKIKAFLLCVLPGLVVPVILILSTWESGHALRYNVDFAWQMLLLAFAVIYYLYNRIRSASLKRALLGVMIACTVLSVITNFALLFQSVPGITNTVFYNKSHTIWYYRIARTLEFWN